MSKYTTEVRFICETNAGLQESEGNNNVASIIANSREKIFDFSYPIFDEAYRSVLETKILKHYYTREICCETVGLWKHFLDMRLNEIMPYYNKLYESELIEFNPLYDVDLTTDHNKENTGKRTGNVSRNSEEDGTYSGRSTNTGTIQTVTDDDTTNNIDESYGINEADVRKNLHWDVYSDTPQGALTNVANETYLTNARKITDDGTGSTKTGTNTKTGENETNRDIDSTETRNLAGTENSTNNVSREEKENSIMDINDLEDYIQHVKGKSGGISYSKLLNEFRDTFLNIDVMIINDLSDLFFNLW